MPPPGDDKSRVRRALIIAIGFCFVFMIVEVAIGILAHSLALMADAMHMLTDVAALALSLFATIVSRWPGSKRLSYGWHRAEVVGALASVFLVWALVGGILYAAGDRFNTMIRCAQGTQGQYVECEGVNAPEMLGVGIGGFFVNVGVACILMWGGHAHSHGGLAGGSGGCGAHGHGDHGHSHDDANHAAVDAGDYHSCGDHTHHHHARHGTHEVRGAGDTSEEDVVNAENAPRRPLLVEGPVTASHRDHDHGHHSDGHDAHSSEANMNVRGAMIHAIGDCFQSIGVVIAAIVIWAGAGKTGNPSSWYNLADPTCSVIFAAITLYATRYLTVDAFYVLMEGVPAAISYYDLFEELSRIDGVTGVSHLHVWALTPRIKSLSVHLICSDAQKHPVILAEATRIARNAGVEHSTVQINVVDVESTVGSLSHGTPSCMAVERGVGGESRSLN